MAYFKRNTDAEVKSLLAFPNVAQSTVQLFDCADGKRAGFRIVPLNVNGVDFLVSQVFDYSSGRGVLLGTVSALAETDLAGGLFASGCFCDRNPLDSGASFYLVDYV